MPKEQIATFKQIMIIRVYFIDLFLIRIMVTGFRMNFEFFRYKLNNIFILHQFFYVMFKRLTPQMELNL